MDKKLEKSKITNQTNNKKESTSKSRKYKRKKNIKKNNCKDLNKNKSTIDDLNKKKNLDLYKFSYADYVLLSSTIAYAIGEDLNDPDLDILIAFFGMITSELAILRTRRGIIDGLSKIKNINNIEDDSIGAIESTQAAESVVSNLSRNVKKENSTNNKKRIKKKRKI